MRRALLIGLTALGCAGRIPLPAHLEVADLEELAARMQAARTQVTRYSAEVRLTYFGKDGRVRTQAVLVAARPASLRYDLMGPHGGVISAFATDGKELQLLDVAHSRFLYGPATVDNLEAVLNIGRLGLDAAGLVRLFFGEVELPPEATLTYDDRLGRFVVAKTSGDEERRVEIDPATSRVVRAVVSRRGQPYTDIRIEERDARGLPTEIRVRLAGEDADLAIELRDVEHDPELDDTVFRLDVPQGVTPEYLSPVAPFGAK